MGRGQVSGRGDGGGERVEDVGGAAESKHTPESSRHGVSLQFLCSFIHKSK